MGFILHLLDAPEISSAADAARFVEEQRHQPPGGNAKFAAFVRDITAVHPDLSEEDLDGDDERNLWEEGIDSDASYGRVKEIVVKVDLTDEAVVRAIREAAVRNGLELYDEEGQILYSS